MSAERGEGETRGGKVTECCGGSGECRGGDDGVGRREGMKEEV